MKVQINVEYYPEYEGEFETYVAKVLGYPELQGYGDTAEQAIQDALGFLEEHLGRPLKVVREEVNLELAS